VKGRCPGPLDDGAGGPTGVGREVLVYRHRRLPVKGRRDLGSEAGAAAGKRVEPDGDSGHLGGEKKPLSSLIPIEDEENSHDSSAGSTVSAFAGACLAVVASLRRIASKTSRR
jgi:hypothetical protein